MKHPGGRPKKNLAELAAEKLIGKEYYTVEEVAQATGAHKNTVKARIYDGTLKAKKLGAYWRIYLQ